MRSYFSNQRRQELAPDVRSYILRDIVAKAAVDDPVHPGWPKDAPDRQGGRFRPKDEVAAADNPTSSPTPSSRPKFSARDIPANNPKHPVPLMDSHGNPITDAQGNPLLRPADLPPEMFVREGQAIRDKFNAALKQDSGLLLSYATAELYDKLRQFGQGRHMGRPAHPRPICRGVSRLCDDCDRSVRGCGRFAYSDCASDSERICLQKFDV